MASKPISAIAGDIMGEHKLLTDANDAVYRYTGAHWRELPRPELRALAYEFDGAASTDRRRREILDLLRAKTFRGGLVWGRVGEAEIACANTIVDVVTGEPRPHKFDDYLERVLPWDYAPGAECPEWEAAVMRAVGGDEQKLLGLQEFFGYAISSHAKFKKALVLEGPKNSAKSLIVTVLRELVGAEQCCALSVEHMDDPVLRAVLVGKALNLVSELTTDAMIADGGFRTLISTEEGILINTKYGAIHTYIPRTKHVFAMNEMPAINDRSEATLDRLLLIVMGRSLTKAEQDRSFFDKRIRPEMRGILLWAISGARRLISQGGQFTESAAAEHRLAELRGDTNPVLEFLAEHCARDPSSAIRLSHLVELYNRWNQGARKVSTRQMGRMLRQAGLLVKNVRFSERTPTCLCGFIERAHHLPERFDIDPDEAAGAEAEIAGANGRHKVG